MNRPLGRRASGSLNFRVVTDEDDIPALVELAREAHEESRFSYIPFNSRKVVRIAEVSLRDKNKNGVFMAFKKDVAVGFAYASVGEFHIGSGALFATIHNINVRRSARGRLSGGRIALGLFSGLESWAKSRGAHEVLAHVTSGVSLAQSHSLMKRLGYKFIGGSYAKAIN